MGTSKAAAVGQRLAHLRTQRQLSTQALATQAHVQYQTIWRLERGLHKDPGLFTMAKIARVLGCSLDWLAGLYADEGPLG